MSCPGDRELVAFLDGSLAPEALVSFEAHVASCEDCAQLVGHVGALEQPGPTVVGGRYKIESLVGRGGMGEVWSAFDPELERRVAIKLIRAQLGDEGSRRLVREARALAKLQDPNVVAVHDVGESDGDIFVVTELVDGETLDVWQQGRDADSIIEAYQQAARGLAAAHARGLVHRDVKPSNLFVGRDGRVRVGDFGLAVSSGTGAGEAVDADAFLASRSTSARGVAGTPAYMAPEQRKGREVDARADQFSLALSLVESLSGGRPKAGASAAQLAECGQLAAVLARSLSIAPDARYSDLEAWSAAVDGARSTISSRSRPSFLRGALVVSALVAVVVGVLVVRSQRSSSAVDSPPAADAGAAVVATRALDAAAVESSASDAAVAMPVARITKRPRPRPTPAQASPPASSTSTTAAPAGTSAIDALEHADKALRVGNAATCLREIQAARGLTGRDEQRARLIRARCEMLSGECAAGSRRIATLEGSSDALVKAESDAYCLPDRGALTTRLRRLYTQVSLFAMQRRFGCARYEAAALSAAADGGLSSITRGKAKLASVFNNLAECHAKARRCERAIALLDDARGHGLGVLPGISTCSE